MTPSDRRKLYRPHRVLPSLSRPVDEYGFVLIAVFVTLIVMGIASDRAAGRIAIPLMFLGILFLTMVTSGLSRRSMLLTTGLIPVVVILAAVAGASESPALKALSPLVSAAMVVASAALIFRRLSAHTVISRRTIFGALCIYLFAALLFATTYSLIGVFGGQPFFVQTDDPSGLDYIYFSFVVIATLGFGDLTPATGVGKMCAIIEAIAGQLYLVVVVALFVGRIGRTLKDQSPTPYLQEDHEQK